jgi:hypothetical protein
MVFGNHCLSAKRFTIANTLNITPIPIAPSANGSGNSVAPASITDGTFAGVAVTAVWVGVGVTTISVGVIVAVAIGVSVGASDGVGVPVGSVTKINVIVALGRARVGVGVVRQVGVGDGSRVLVGSVCAAGARADEPAEFDAPTTIELLAVATRPFASRYFT